MSGIIEFCRFTVEVNLIPCSANILSLCKKVYTLQDIAVCKCCPPMFQMMFHVAFVLFSRKMGQNLYASIEWRFFVACDDRGWNCQRLREVRVARLFRMKVFYCSPLPNKHGIRNGSMMVDINVWEKIFLVAIFRVSDVSTNTNLLLNPRWRGQNKGNTVFHRVLVLWSNSSMCEIGSCLQAIKVK